MIYFIQQGQDGPIKIGFTEGEIDGRLSSLQTGNPEVLRCIGIVDGTIPDERALHKQFAAYHIRGEWFQTAPELFQYLRAAIKDTEYKRLRTRLLGDVIPPSKRQKFFNAVRS